MTNKKKDPNKEYGNWGGRRAGSGRKRQTLEVTDKQVKAMLTTARKKAREEGKTIDDILMDIIYGKLAYEVEKRGGRIQIIFEVTPKDKIAAIKLFKEFTMARKSQVDKTVRKIEGPAIGLPPMRQDPALKIVKSGQN